MRRRSADPTEPEWGGLEGVNRLLEHRLRLAICVLLSRFEKVKFSRFKELLGETDGNLGAHLRRLEDAGYIAVEKVFADRKPVSWYRLTRRGREAIHSHVEALSALLNQVQEE